MATTRQTRALTNATFAHQGSGVNIESQKKTNDPVKKKPGDSFLGEKAVKRTAFVDLTNASKHAKPVNVKNLKKVTGVKRRKSNVPIKKFVPVKKRPVAENKISKFDKLPSGVIDYDEECRDDPNQEPFYVKDIFRYYLSIEKQYKVESYMPFHPELNALNRSILVDWMVEVQENFELNHETLYLAVKLVDFYLMKTMSTPLSKGNLQLLGTTAMFLSSKFDERTAPLADDFLYICEDAYTRRELFLMEIEILKVMDFKLGMPISYRFLRRYARSARLSIEILTLARFILETSLMFYEFVSERDSLMAAAALSLALRMKFPDDKEVWWTKTLQYYSGYHESEFTHLIAKLNNCISTPTHDKINVIRNKYSHPAFFNVAEIPPLQKDKL